MKLIFASFGTQRRKKGTRGLRRSLALPLLSARCWSSGPHPVTRPRRCRSSPGPAGPSDVHLELSVIPNGLLPVMIVQVVQIVYFYFGVFD